MARNFENVGVMGALPAEVELLDKHVAKPKTEKLAMRSFRSGWLGDQRVTIVHSRMAKVAAAVTATTLIQHFKVDAIVFSGVAGALSHDLHVGDIVVAEDLVHHDVQSNPAEYARGEVPLLRTRELPTDDALRRCALDAAKDFLDTGLSELLPQEELAALGIGRPRTVSGRIATGEEFIHGDLKETVRDRAPGAMCVDMEGAAVAQVCYEHDGVPVCVIRAISDVASHGATVAFPIFRDSLARHYSYEVLRRMFGPSLPVPTQLSQ